MDPCLKSEKNIESEISARKIVLSGHVQGVGFRPFVYRLAREHNLFGWVRNCVGVVEVHVQGRIDNLECFVADIVVKNPPLASPVIESQNKVDVGEYRDFNILRSVDQGEARISVPADLYMCDECLSELNNPSDRRYHYPFINCTQCGPRYTLICSLPYDRPNTTMVSFDLCPQCRDEYESPENRRFHAEPVACEVCGPVLTFHAGASLVTDNKLAIEKTVEALRNGKVVAVKGIGGYHLMCDASNAAAVTLLRNNKPRPHKPLAVMFPAPDEAPLEYAERFVALRENDRFFLQQAARPILLVEKSELTGLAAEIAPGLGEVGIMLPYTPLHHLLLDAFDGPLVATSANISGEPVLTNNEDVEQRLGHVVNAFLHHNRAIERPADDPVYRRVAGKPRPVRIGRGCAPLEFTLPFELVCPVLAVGAHMKNTITLAWKNRAVTSPHIGEMNSARSLEVFENTIKDLQKLYDVTVERIICDAHPAYATTRWAYRQNIPVQSVYHHHAHASAAYYECETDNKLIAFSWDGVGYGEDGSLWGGETFVGKPGSWQRVASMRPFNLPGGEKAGREPWRSAAALCWEVGYAYDEIPEKDPLLKHAWQKKINAPQTTSVGRLFDAAAALTGVCPVASYEGQGPMEFEALCAGSEKHVELELYEKAGLLLTDWQALVPVMLDSSLSVGSRASIFHASLAHAILNQARMIRNSHGLNAICFSGGVFQNRILSEHAMKLLSEDGFDVCFPEIVPVNDAGISFGQVIEYGHKQ